MSETRGFNPWVQLPVWTAGGSLAGLVIGVAVGLFNPGGLETPIVVISVLFGNVVGLTAMICSVVLVPRLDGLTPLLRWSLLGLGLVSGSVTGSVAVLNLYPLFVFREPRLAVAVVAINGLLSLIVGGVVFTYERMRLRLQQSLHEVEEVRLVESRLREAAARSELAALQARINPHFFFNTLNTIASLVEEDPDEAAEVVQTLAGLFRYTFKVSDTEPVSLREELDFTRGYLRIEQARFGERLRIEWDVDRALLAVAVPGMILQPLVENAVGHGIAPRAAGGLVKISVRREGAGAVVEVADDGVGLSDAPQASIRDGHGLGNVQQRLEAAYRGRARLELMTIDPGTLARLVLPGGV